MFDEVVEQLDEAGEEEGDGEGDNLGPNCPTSKLSCFLRHVSIPLVETIYCLLIA